MGKPFAEEIASLPGTFEWALRQPIEGLERPIRALSSLPLIAAGSGGSYTVAHLACALHGFYTKRMAQAVTPLQLISSPSDLRDLAVFIPTAGGKNPDVLGAFRHLIWEEPRSVMVWCATLESPLAAAASKYRFVDYFDFSMPCGKDGFLAVNSVLAFGVLLARSYASAFGADAALPRSFDELIGDPSWSKASAVDRKSAGLWKRETLVVLHGPSTLPAAVDLESKLTEAALGSSQLADYRHFAHGRHHWIAKRGADTAVLAIISDDDRRIAESMLALLPPDIPVVRLDVPHSGWLAAMSAIARGFFLTASAGRARGIDPGDPGVPAFGREIYHTNVYGRAPVAFDMPPDECVSIERKAREKIAGITRAGRLDEWRAAYRSACSTLAETTYCGLVLDYDGTLCDEVDRFGPLPEAVADEFTRLLRTGAFIGIATGRGKSVRQSLQRALPRELWARVVIGYYNGAEVGGLGDDTHPDDRKEVDPELEEVVDGLRSDAFISRMASCTLRPRQVTLTPADGVFPGPLWEYVHSLLIGLNGKGAIALRSGHSVDILTSKSSKLAVVERVREMAGSGDAPVLRIGDRGRWPGNDFALLDSPHALSADEVSPDPNAAWNLAPAGHRGSQATLGYLRRLRTLRGGLRLGPKPAKKSVR